MPFSPEPTTKTPSNDESHAPAAAELTAVVDDLLDSLSAKFAGVSSEIYEKIEAMSKRLDEMERVLERERGKQ